MSTLKKILALTLALAMVLSLNVFAAFNDQSSIDEDCVDAMELMEALGIMLGDNNGNANPTATITRAEASAMIFRLMNRGRDNASIYTGARYFTDVATGIWYEGYVNYAYQMAIIAGRTATTFDPQAPVTGYELAKMLLCCLKYKQDVEGYTGANWASNVQNDAFMAGMLDNYGMSLAAPAQRQWAAVMFADALNCDIVTYFNGEIIDFGESETLIANKFNLDSATGVVVAINYATLDATNASAPGRTNRVKVNFGGTIGVKQLSKSVDPSYLGQEVKVYVQGTVAGTISSTYAVLLTGDNTVATAGMSDIDADGSDFTIGDVELKMDATTVFAVNDYNSGTPRYATTDNQVSTFASATDTYDNSTVVAIDNDDDGTAEYVIITESTYGEIDIRRNGNVVVPGVATINSDDVSDDITYVGTVADGDMVKATVNPITGKIAIEALEAKVGVITRKASSNNTITVAGTTYGVSVDKVSGLSDFSSYNLRDSVEFYTDGKHIVSISESETSSGDGMPTLVLVTAVGQKTDDDIYNPTTIKMMKVLGIDNKVTEYQFEACADTDVTGDAVGSAVTDGEFGSGLVGKVYELVNNGDGTYGLGELQASYASGDYTQASGGSSYASLNISTSRLGNVRIAADTRMFMAYKDSNDKDAFTVVTVADLKGNQTWDSNDWFYYESVNGISHMTVGYFGGNFNADASDAVYAILTALGSVYLDETDDEEYFDFSVIYADDPANEVDLINKTNSSPAAVGTNEDDFVTIVEDNGIYTVTEFAFTDVGTAATVNGIDSTSIMLGSTLYDVADDAVIVFKVMNSGGSTLKSIEFAEMADIIDAYEDKGADASDYTYVATMTALADTNSDGDIAVMQITVTLH